MIENTSLYNRAKDQLPQPLRNRLRATARFMIDLYAGMRGLNPNCASPDFLIVGAQKAGTTSLFNWLVDSGSVQPPIVKEVGYFDARWNWPIKYRGYFNPKKPGRLVGEATPSYFAFPEVPERVIEKIGAKCKIVIVLRDPVGRSVSHYFHERRLGFEKRDMYTAMTEEENLINEALDSKTSTSRREYILTHFSYAYRSCYSERLKPWLEQFDKNNLLIVKSEDMFADPGQTVESVANFLDMKVNTSTHYKARNKNSYVFEDSRVAKFLENRLSDETRLFDNWNY